MTIHPPKEIRSGLLGPMPKLSTNAKRLEAPQPSLAQQQQLRPRPTFAHNLLVLQPWLCTACTLAPPPEPAPTVVNSLLAAPAVQPAGSLGSTPNVDKQQLAEARHHHLSRRGQQRLIQRAVSLLAVAAPRYDHHDMPCWLSGPSRAQRVH